MKYSIDNPQNYRGPDSESSLEIDLVSVPADFGEGANDGAYYPVGLLTIATHLSRVLPCAKVRVVDVGHDPTYRPRAAIVGISASSTLNYRNVLRVAQEAKANGAIVVLGGPHATQLSTQILRNRDNLVDFVIRGNGEVPFVELVQFFQDRRPPESVSGLSWRSLSGAIVHNKLASGRWNYDDYLPVNLGLLSSGVDAYWTAFRTRIDSSVDAAFLVFTHFGCGYRENMESRSKSNGRSDSWCTYCSLNDRVSIRSASAIVNDVLQLLKSTGVSPGSNVLLKCYGDNVGTHPTMLRDLALAIEESKEWRSFHIGWTFYAQSSRITAELVQLLVRVGTRNLYVGFDSADDEIQRLNGLGTSSFTHRRAVRLCKDASIKIQAGFVLGCAGETQRSIETTIEFAEDLASSGVLERTNSAILVVMPGSPAYTRLCRVEPWVETLDELPTEEIQALWLKHFCPELGMNPAEGLRILRRAANRIDQLSPGPHASMGFASDRLRSAGPQGRSDYI